MAAVVAFLAGEDSRFITGQTIYVNGGSSMADDLPSITRRTQFWRPSPPLELRAPRTGPMLPLGGQEDMIGDVALDLLSSALSPQNPPFGGRAADQFGATVGAALKTGL